MSQKELISKPKICILIPRLGISDRGAEIFAYEMAKKLSQHFTVSVWVRFGGQNSKIIKDLKRHKIEIQYIHCISSDNILSRLFYNISYGRKYLNKFHLQPDEIEMLTFTVFSLPKLFFSQFDLIFPNQGFWGALVCRLVRFFWKIPFVYTSHGGIEPMIVKQKPDYIFAINSTIKRWINKYYPQQKVVLVPNGVNLKRFNPIGAKVDLKLQHPIFMVVGALIPVKNIDLTIKAFSKLKKGSLLIIGNGELRNELMNLAKNLLNKKRFLFMQIDNWHMPKYYRSVDFFTLAGQNEPANLVFLEAMASNLPLIINNEPKLQKMIGNAGLTCNVNNLVSYVKSLESISKKDFGQKPLRKAEAYSWDIVSKKYIQIFQKLIKNNFYENK